MSQRIAICIQVYNEATYLRATLASILAQTHAAFDLYISDNHSTDGTTEIIRSFQVQDKRVHLWQPPRFCKSLEHARFLFEGLNQRNHEASLYLGGHDLLEADYLERLVAAYDAHPGAAMVVGHGDEIDLQDKHLRQWPNVPQFIGGIVPFRPLVMLMSLYYNLGAFGLWSAKARRGVPLRHDCVGADHLMMAQASLLGDIVVEPRALIHTRRTEGAGHHASYFKKHISDDMQARTVVANFERQLEWVRHINDLAFAQMSEPVRQINLASTLGCYLTRYGMSQLTGVEGALDLWLQSETGLRIAGQLNHIGGIAQRALAAAALAPVSPSVAEPMSALAA
jgi:glycosyltransferase involved in cell wall biosynthesis